MSAIVSHREVSLVPPKHRVQMRPVGSAMFSENAWEEIARSLRLSGREMQIVRSVFDDDTDFGIAQHMGISLTRFTPTSSACTASWPSSTGSSCCSASCRSS